MVLSDETAASARIEEFARGDQRWMVAVRMVSEGVDVPRLAVGVYATSASTPLFFAQAVGRFVRARRRGETASVFLPTCRTCSSSPRARARRDHALDRRSGDDDDDGLDDELLEAANREEKAAEELARLSLEALGLRRSFDRVLYDGTEFGTGAEPGSEEEYDFIGIPGHPRARAGLRSAAPAAGAAGAARGGAAQAPSNRSRPEPVALYRT